MVTGPAQIHGGRKRDPPSYGVWQERVVVSVWDGRRWTTLGKLQSAQEASRQIRCLSGGICNSSPKSDDGGNLACRKAQRRFFLLTYIWAEKKEVLLGRPRNSMPLRLTYILSTPIPHTSGTTIARPSSLHPHSQGGENSFNVQKSFTSTVKYGS